MLALLQLQDYLKSIFHNTLAKKLNGATSIMTHGTVLMETFLIAFNKIRIKIYGIVLVFQK